MAATNSTHITSDLHTFVCINRDDGSFDKIWRDVWEPIRKGETRCVRHMIRTSNNDLFPGFDPFVRVCVAGSDENERRGATVTEGAGHGCPPNVSHGTR